MPLLWGFGAGGSKEGAGAIRGEVGALSQLSGNWGNIVGNIPAGSLGASGGGGMIFGLAVFPVVFPEAGAFRVGLFWQKEGGICNMYVSNWLQYCLPPVPVETEASKMGVYHDRARACKNGQKTVVTRTAVCAIMYATAKQNKKKQKSAMQNLQIDAK